MILFSKSIFLDIETIKKLKEIKEVDLKDKFLPKDAVLNFLRQKDYNISVYLIGLFREKIEFIDNEIILEITNLFINKEVIPKNVNNLFAYVLKRPLKDVSFQIFMKAASKLDLKKKEFEFIKDYFGYSQIYQYSKNILEKMLTQDYSVNEIGYALILLNHPQLCYKNLMPLFKKINEYAKYDQKNVLESGLINVCKGVQAVVLFSPETFTSKQPLLFSIFIFLNNILFYSEFYEFIDLKGLDLFLITNFYIMAILYLDTNSKTTLKGIFNKTLQEINTLIYKKIMIYDDFLYLYSLMYQANMLFWYVTIKEEEVDVLVNLIKELENYKIHKPKYIDNNIFKKTNTLIVKEKYNLMNNVSIIGKYNLNTSLFIDEIENIDDAQFVLSDLKAEFFNWELIIEVACKEKNQSAFLDLIFTVKDPEILSRYIESVFSSKNINLTLEILTSKKDTLVKLINHKKILHIIFKLFLKGGSSSDIRFYQIRLISLELINQLKNEIDTTIFIDLFKFERSSEFYILLLYVAYLAKEISEIVINEFINISENKSRKEMHSDHELELISQKAKTEDNILLKNEEIFFNIHENKTFIKNFKAQKEIELKLEETSISNTNDLKLENDNLFKNLSKEYQINIHILALMISKTEKETLLFKKENSFYFLYLKLLSYCFKKKIDKNYIQLEIELLEFLFIANEYEKRELQVLFTYVKSDFLGESESIYIQTHKKIENIFYNLN